MAGDCTASGIEFATVQPVVGGGGGSGGVDRMLRIGFEIDENFRALAPEKFGVGEGRLEDSTMT